MSGYRDKYFRNAHSLFGKYRCQHCGGWFNKKDIDVDHIIPRSKGGTDSLVNLQALCKHCNRSKKASMSRTAPDLAKNAVKVGAKSLFRGIFRG